MKHVHVTQVLIFLIIHVMFLCWWSGFGTTSPGFYFYRHMVWIWKSDLALTKLFFVDVSNIYFMEFLWDMDKKIPAKLLAEDPTLNVS